MDQESGKDRRVLNCIPSRDTEKDWRPRHADQARAARAGQAALPPSVDLRAGRPWWKIGDQGSTGSCVGWATADSVLRWHFTEKGRLPKKASLSPRFIWMAAKETDEFRSEPTTFIEADGTSLKAALDISRRFGVVAETVLPFSGGLFQGETEDFFAIAAQLKIASYHNVGLDPLEWRRWLAKRGPILTRLDCDDTWMNAVNGQLKTYHPDTRQGGHAVAIVGYRADGSFIVRNSWATIWGDAGYAYASKAYAAAAFTEAYGVLV